MTYLLLHGLCSRPEEWDVVGPMLGDHVRLALQGHGTCPEDLACVTRDDHRRQVDAAYAQAKARYGTVVLAGMSYGGLLALDKAIRDPTVDAVVSICTPLYVRSPLAPVAPLLDAVCPAWLQPHLMPNGNTERPHRTYGRMPFRAGAELVRLGREVLRGLPRMRTPTMLVASLGDPKIREPQSIDTLCAGIPAQVETLRFTTMYHTLLDPDPRGPGVPEQIAARMRGFVEQL